MPLRLWGDLVTLTGNPGGTGSYRLRVLPSPNPSVDVTVSGDSVDLDKASNDEHVIGLMVDHALSQLQTAASSGVLSGGKMTLTHGYVEFNGSISQASARTLCSQCADHIADTTLPNGTKNTPITVTENKLISLLNIQDSGDYGISGPIQSGSRFFPGPSPDNATITKSGGTYTITPASNFAGPVSLDYFVRDPATGRVGGGVETIVFKA